MALIVDPDLIPQGALTTSTTAGFSAKSGDTITIGGTADLPALTAGDYFEVRDAPTAANNGLYLETGGSPTTSSITADKVDGVPPENDAGPDTIRFFGNTTTEKVIHYDTAARKIWLLRQDTVVAADGIQQQAIYSRMKIDWKDDDDLNKHPFPAFSVDADPAGKLLLGTDGVNSNGWAYEDTANNSRELVRDGGWSEQNGDGYLGVSADGTVERIYSGIKTLPTADAFEDSANDKAYYTFGSDPTVDSTADMVFAGEVNEVVKCYDNIVEADAGTGVAITLTTTLTRNDAGNFITDGFVVGGQMVLANCNTPANNGTYTILTLTSTVITTTGLTNDAADNTMTIAFDNTNAFAIFMRVRDADPSGKTFSAADLAAAGRTAIGGYVTPFGLTNAADLKITETDANISTNSPYTEVRIRYLDAAYNREVDTTTARNFGIVIDVGTYSHSNGATTATALLTSANFVLGAGEALADYTGGTITLHDTGDADETTHTISGTPVDNAGTLEVTVTVAFGFTNSNISFTIDRATPVTATTTEIYEKIQYQMRQATNINETGSGVVIGKTADVLAFFDGDTLRYGNTLPTNPEGGGGGVVVEGYDANDTNAISVRDNGDVQRTFPFVAAGNLNFSQTLIDDGADAYKLYFQYTERFTNTGFGLSAVSGATATLDSSTTDLTAELSDGDYIELTGFTATENDGIYVLTGAPAGAGPYTAPVRKLQGNTLTNEAAAASISLDKNPLNSPDAIIVDDNGGADISGVIASSPVAFTFDYDNNVQGGRTAGTDAEVALRAIGSDTAKFAQALHTIDASVGQSITVTSPQERDYNNP